MYSCWIAMRSKSRAKTWCFRSFEQNQYHLHFYSGLFWRVIVRLIFKATSVLMWSSLAVTLCEECMKRHQWEGSDTWGLRVAEETNQQGLHIHTLRESGAEKHSWGLPVLRKWEHSVLTLWDLRGQHAETDTGWFNRRQQEWGGNKPTLSGGRLTNEFCVCVCYVSSSTTAEIEMSSCLWQLLFHCTHPLL